MHSKTQIKHALERIYKKYNRFGAIKPDPLQFVYRYDESCDMEIAALLASALAYGRVEQIEKSLDNLFDLMGKSPAEFAGNFGRAERKKLKNFKHRFTKGDDISDLLELLRDVLNDFGGIESFFLAGYNLDDENIIPALSKFCDTLLACYTQNHRGRLSKGLAYLLPKPALRSTCKRLNLFLRWMVRKDDVDTGLWVSVDKSKLIVPLDVHMARLSRILGFHTHKTISMKTAAAVTRSFAAFEPNDPVKYDFALSRIGIVENCTGKCRIGCEACELFKFCR
jgi:uncharacterized protein (TIGR02757 family)